MFDSDKLIQFIDATALRSIYLKPKLEGSASIGTSKIGGAPDLPDHIPYPVGRDGLYIFQAQLNLSEIAPYQSFLPRTGMLWFFSSDEQFYMGTHAKVIFSEGCTPSSLNRRWPSPDEIFGDDNRHLDCEHAVTPLIGPSFYHEPSGVLELFPELAAEDTLSEEESDRFTELLNSPRCEELHVPTQIEGTGSYQVHCINSFLPGGDLISEQCIDELRLGYHPNWVNLLQVESIAGRNVWDAGTLSFSIKKEQLAARDFSQIVLTLATG